MLYEYIHINIERKLCIKQKIQNRVNIALVL